jgi:hypothetical protein
MFIYCYMSLSIINFQRCLVLCQCGEVLFKSILDTIGEWSYIWHGYKNHEQIWNPWTLDVLLAWQHLICEYHVTVMMHFLSSFHSSIPPSNHACHNGVVHYWEHNGYCNGWTNETFCWFFLCLLTKWIHLWRTME